MNKVKMALLITTIVVSSLFMSGKSEAHTVTYVHYWKGWKCVVIDYKLLLCLTLNGAIYEAWPYRQL